MLSALASSLLFGVSDFFGGLAARRMGTLLVTTISYVAATLVLGLVALAVAGTWSAAAVGAGAVAGIAALVGFVTFYAALAAGPISLLSPGISLVQSAVPVLFALAVHGERLLPMGWAGVAVALLAGLLVAAPAGPASGRLTQRPLLLALVAGVTLGASVVALDAAPPDAGVIPVLVEGLVGSLLLVAAMSARRLKDFVAPSSAAGPWLLALGGGVLLGAANGLLMAALHGDALTIVAVLLGLYPLGTVLLAAVVLHERLRPHQMLGVALAILATILLGLS